MNHSRRSFLRNSAMGLGALAFASPALQALAAAKYKKLVGVQLYSIREDMRKDPQGTLNALAEMDEEAEPSKLLFKASGIEPGWFAEFYNNKLRLVEINTYFGNNGIGLGLNYDNSFYWLGDYNEINNKTHIFVDDGNRILLLFKGTHGFIYS